MCLRVVTVRIVHRFRLLEARHKDKRHSSFAFVEDLDAVNSGQQHAEQGHPRGTVGCVARDASGQVAAATSTGGTPFKEPGRVGDCPIPSAGYFANHSGACSATGWGEAILTLGVSARAVAHCERAGSDVAEVKAEDAGGSRTAVAGACRAAVEELHGAVVNPRGQGATGGVIVVDAATGAAGFAYSTPRMARGGWVQGTADVALASAQAPWVALDAL